MAQLSLATSRLQLREYQLADLTAVHAYASQAEVMQYQAWGPNTLAETEEFLQDALATQLAMPRTVYELAIVLRGEGALIGGVGLFLQAEDLNLATMGYILHPDYWGQGLATEAGQAVVALAQRIGVRTLRATCDERNAASRRVLEKLGLSLQEVIPRDFKQKTHWRTTLVLERVLH